MTKRRTPVDTAWTSTVIYPSALFSLERDEVFPYERFAYNLLDVGVEALHARNLPENVTIDFTQLLPGCSPWSINANVTVKLGSNGQPTAFHFAVPELVPAILYMFAGVLVSDFFDEEAFDKFRHNPTSLRERIQFFIDGASAGARTYRDKGFGPAVRAAYDHLGLTIRDLQKSSDDFNLLTTQMANHEVAHAYVQQATRRQPSTPLEKTSFELIADLVAAEWFYNKMIRNTPDTEEYREFRGMHSYAETIFANSLASLRSQQALVILMAIAGAQKTGGAISLAGGPTHPPGMQRYLLQHLHLYTLIRSNFSVFLSEDHLHQLDEDWDSKMDVLTQSGVIPVADLGVLLDTSECDTIEVAANLIEELGIPELKKVVPMLRNMRDLLSESLLKNCKKS